MNLISRIKVITLTCFSLTIMTGCAQDETFDDMFNRLTDGSVEVVYPKDVADKPVVLLDAREPNEFAVSHLKGARNIGYDDFSIEILKDIPKDTEIVIYCSVGYRSEKVGEQLQEAGFENVSNLYGGIFHWVNEGGEVVNDSGATPSVHAYNKKWGKWLTEGDKVYD